MRSLRERLLGLRGAPGTLGPSPSADELSRRIQRLRIGTRKSEEPPRADSDLALAQLLGATVQAPGLLLLETRIPGQHRHGRFALCGLSQLPPARSGAPGGTGFLFLDTETTGLSGGSGTVVFLVGVARWRGDGLEVRQYLITGFQAEAAMLDALMADLQAGEQLVTYNGKSYDLPLLATRCVLHHRANRLEGLSHLDLLHPVRRRFASQWENCRLGTVERRLLGIERGQDMPGAEAPRAWRRYLETGRYGALQGVIRHNHLDLLGLALLLPALQSNASEAPGTPTPPLPVSAGPEATACRDSAARARLWELRRALDARGSLSSVAETPRHRKSDADPARAWSPGAQLARK